ncbi:MAG: hypothetical protein D6705_06685 [Deltaproteobacteria bacterium]|nr:MAG: hypothetical protein D6705_06685 [Deltaproteobacteria bacterium]
MPSNPRPRPGTTTSCSAGTAPSSAFRPSRARTSRCSAPSPRSWRPRATWCWSSSPIAVARTCPWCSSIPWPSRTAASPTTWASTSSCVVRSSTTTTSAARRTCSRSSCGPPARSPCRPTPLRGRRRFHSRTRPRHRHAPGRPHGAAPPPPNRRPLHRPRDPSSHPEVMTMSTARITSLAAVLAALVVPGCQRGSVSDIDCPLPGDLVVTEIFANPSGADEGGEWFEIANVSSVSVDMTGMRLVASRLDGSAQKRHFVADLVLEPGAYVALGDVPNEGLPEHLGYGYDRDLGSLTNTGGTLSIECGGTVIDTVTYENAPEDASLALDGSMPPDALRNDDPAQWCEADVEYAPGKRGTPGAANPACFGPPTCDDGGTARPAEPPAPGDLVITEVMPDPSAAADADGEWFEVLVTADVDLNGLELGTEPGAPKETVSDPSCLRVAAGTRLVFARNSDPAANGGLPTVDRTFGFGLPNAGGGLVLSVDGTVLDAVTWSGTTAGAARNLDPNAEDPTANDDPNAWCDATAVYGDGDLGTPGQANTPCGGGGGDECLDGITPRPIVPPGPGDLVITEVMPNPSAVADADGEWFEVLVTADVDLNGIGIGTSADMPATVLSDLDCLSVTAGTRLVFARVADTTQNGGLPPVDVVFGHSLVNSDGTLVLSTDGTVVDSVTWASAPDGASLALDPSAEDATANDDPNNWCAATTPYGDGDLGTPAAANPPCAGGDTCLDGGSPRPIVAPTVGDLVITEVMPNPNAVADAAGEWFEVLVTADVDLNGLDLGADIAMPDATLTSADCLRVMAGTRLLFARNADPLQNGGLPTPDFTFSFGLVNANGSLQIGLSGALLDAVTWTSASAGASLSLDPSAEDPAANDDPNNWCDGAMAYGDGDLGTPAATNPPCPMGDSCLDGGNLRAVVPPTVGDLVITEVMPNPNAVSDAAGEWFEVLATADVDLNGIGLGPDPLNPATTLASPNCLSVTTGDRILFARNQDTATNGGLPPVDHTFGFSLVNTNGTLSLVRDGTTLDTVTWATSNTGASWTLDPTAEDPVSNDDAMNWCPATMAYGDGDLGSPKAMGEMCP